MKGKRLLIASISIVVVTLLFFTPHQKEEQIRTRMAFEPFSAVSDEGDDPIARAKYEFNMLKDPKTGKIPEGIRERELKYAETLPKLDARNSLFKANIIQGLTWSSRGPVNQGGRTRALAIDVNDENRILAGGVSGGMWYSTNGGSNWIKSTSNSSTESVTCLAQDTRSGHTDTWYYGTGEYRGNTASGGGAFYYGDGIFRSDDKGVTWTRLPSTSGALTSFDQYYDISFNLAIDASRTDSSIVYAATYARIFRSNNGGTSWTYVLGGTQGSYSDVAVTSSGVVYATLASNTTGGGGVFRSTNGLTWTNITPTTWPTTYARTVLAIAPSNENIVYFLCESATSGTSDCKIWKYTYPGSGNGAGDGNWIDESANRPSLGGKTGDFDSQLSYDLVIKVKPDDENFVVFGGTNLYRTTDGFTTSVGTSGWIGGYTNTDVNSYAQYPNHHADQHSLVFLPSDNKVILSGSDGGLKKTMDVTATNVSWTDISNGYQTSQYYSIAIDRGTSGNNVVMGGMQDNGTMWTNSSSASTSWVVVGSGDGGFAAIADGRTSYYIGSQSGTIYRETLDNSGNLTDYFYVTPAGATGFIFIPPYVLDPNDNKMMYLAAGNDIWRNSDLTQIPHQQTKKATINWTDLTNTHDTTITAITVSKTPANILYYGNNVGKVFRLDTANTGNPMPVNISGGSFPSGGYVSCIAVDRDNADNVLVVFSNYNVQSLFYSSNATNASPTWTAVGGNLEPVSDGPSVRWAIISNFGGSPTYFVGTSVGLFSTTTLNGGSTVWSQEGSSTIANNVVTMIDYRESDGLIVVSTHGGGVFSASQTAVGVESEMSNIPTSYVLNQNYPNPFNPSTKINFTLPSPGNVILTVYDITGKKVGEILDQQLAAGSHTADFNASNLASGTYIYQIRAGNFVEAKKMVLLK